MFDLVQQLTKIAPRYGRDEQKAAKIITDYLNSLSIPYKEELFDSSVPRTINSELFADNVPIPCVGSSLVSGEIEDGEHLLSGFGFSGENHPFNISYSPITDEICVVDFFREPSVTVSRNSIVQIVMANDVHGVVEVEEEKFQTENILVGNFENPQNVVFAHFDSIIANGAVDNAGSVAVLMEAVKSNPDIFINTLVVFSGNEEVSYDDYKTKSGYGFRVFEQSHVDILRKARQIIVVDGIGVSSPLFAQTGLDWVLQVKVLDEIRNKVYWLQNDQSEVLKYFHTIADIVDNLQEKYLEEARVALVERLK